MKNTLLSATALALLLTSPVLAAPDDHGDHHDAGADATLPATAAPTALSTGHAAGGHHGGQGGGQHDQGGGATDGTGRHHGSDNAGGANPFTGGTTGGAMGATRNRSRNTGGASTNNPFTGGTTGGAMGGGTHDGSRNIGGAANTLNSPAPGGHAGRNHNSAFDALRRNRQATQRFQFGAYHRPHGWYAHRWVFGEFLPSFFSARNYWIRDYQAYGLPEPPDGLVWVRDGSDALLIDQYSGEVVQVVYEIFY